MNTLRISLIGKAHSSSLHQLSQGFGGVFCGQVHDGVQMLAIVESKKRGLHLVQKETTTCEKPLFEVYIFIFEHLF